MDRGEPTLVPQWLKNNGSNGTGGGGGSGRQRYFSFSSRSGNISKLIWCILVLHLPF